MRRTALALAIALAVMAAPSPARADPAAAAVAAPTSCTFALSTAYGPVSVCFRWTGGSTGQVFYFNGYLETSQPITGPLPVLDYGIWGNFVRSTDGVYAPLASYARFQTAYGSMRWGVQRHPTQRLGRFGKYQAEWDLFEPTSGWQGIA